MQIEQDCVNDNCTIDINKSIYFDWDKMVVFSSSAPPETINSALGIEYPYFEEFTRPFIFLKNNKIVHYENNELNVEGPINGEVAFDHPDSIKYSVYFKKKPYFKVKKVHFGKGTCYLLSQ